MRIIQLLSNISYGDAVSNDAIALNNMFQKWGYETGIYAAHINEGVDDSIAKKEEQLKVKKDDILMYHFCIGNELNYRVVNYSCRRILIYHNITPPTFFRGINHSWELSCVEGIKGARFLADKMDYCLADSEFNKRDLIKMGYKCPIDVLPVLIPFEDYKKEKEQKVIEQFGDGKTNIIFVGRIAPNKKHEDIIESFAYYKKYFDADARLFLVGSYSGMERYRQSLNKYIEYLEVEDIYFTGHIKFSSILAYYGIADIFLCMSEHEGFCVPLIEAMFFNVPIIAFDSTAIAETLGGSGILVKEKKHLEIAGLIHRIMQNSNLRKNIIYEQQERLKAFQQNILEEKLEQYITKFL